MNRFERWLMPLWVKTPPFAHMLYPDVLWQMPNAEPCLYLTFDDGPTPGITPWVLQQLDAYQAKATFFCLGRQAEKYPAILHQTLELEHSVGNHSYNHLNGWKTPLAAYMQDIANCARLVPSALFRPPYGAITPAQVKYLLQNPQVCRQNMPPRIVMWSVVSADWNRDLPWQQCYRHVVQNVSVKPSDLSPVVVFHDSEKAFPNLKEILPRIMEYYARLGFAFKAIPSPIRQAVQQ